MYSDHSSHTMCRILWREHCPGCGWQFFEWDYTANPIGIGEKYPPSGRCSKREDSDDGNPALGIPARPCVTIREQYEQVLNSDEPKSQRRVHCHEIPGCCIGQIALMRSKRDDFKAKHDQAREEREYHLEGGFDREADGCQQLKMLTRALTKTREFHRSHCAHHDDAH